MAAGGLEARVDGVERRIDRVAESTAHAVGGAVASVAAIDRQLAELRAALAEHARQGSEALVTAQEARRAATDARTAADAATSASMRCMEAAQATDPIVGELLRAEYAARLKREETASAGRAALWARLTDSGLWAHVPAWVGIVALAVWLAMGGPRLDSAQASRVEQGP